MKYLRTIIVAFVFTLALSAGAALAAVEVYHWVDENGVLNFSEDRPPGNPPGVTTLQVEDQPPPSYDPEEVIYDVEAHAEKMNARREEKRKQREKALERQRLAASQQPVQEILPVNTYSRSLWFPPYQYRPPVRPPLRPRPPIAPPETPSSTLKQP